MYGLRWPTLKSNLWIGTSARPLFRSPPSRLITTNGPTFLICACLGYCLRPYSYAAYAASVLARVQHRRPIVSWGSCRELSKSLKTERPMNIIVLLMCTKTPFIASTDPNHNTSSLIEPASLNLMKEVVNSPTTDEDPGTLFAEDGVVAEKPAKPGALDQRESKCRIIPSRT